MGYTIMRSCFEIHPEQKKNSGLHHRACLSYFHPYPYSIPGKQASWWKVNISQPFPNLCLASVGGRCSYYWSSWPSPAGRSRWTEEWWCRGQQTREYHDPDILYVGQICLEKANEESLINLSKLTKSKPTTTNASSKLWWWFSYPKFDRQEYRINWLWKREFTTKPNIRGVVLLLKTNEIHGGSAAQFGYESPCNGYATHTRQTFRWPSFQKYASHSQVTKISMLRLNILFI